MKARTSLIALAALAVASSVPAFGEPVGSNSPHNAGFDDRGNYAISIKATDVDINTPQGWSTLVSRAERASVALCTNNGAFDAYRYRDALLASCKASVLEDIMRALTTARSRAATTG